MLKVNGGQMIQLSLELPVVDGNDQKLEKNCREITKQVEALDVLFLAEQHRNECNPTKAFVPDVVLLNCHTILMDAERNNQNLWLAYKDGKPVGYAVGFMSPFMYNYDYCARLEILFVLPEHRGSWTAIKLLKCFEEWARLGGALEIYAGVARLDKDEAKHIRKLFPKLNYEWCGSYYIKETTK